MIAIAVAGIVLAPLVVVAQVKFVGVGPWGGGGSSDRAVPRGEATEVSTDRLRSFASSTGRPVYWLGEMPERKLELTRNRRGDVFLRYLKEDARVGDKRPAFTAVGTLRLKRSLGTLRRRAKESSWSSQKVGPGLAAWSKKRPTNVYVASPRLPLLVEIYDPNPRRARELAVSGALKPLR